MLRSMVTKYLMTKDIFPNMKGFNTTISAQFKQEMFLSWTSDQNCIKHDLLPGLSKFIVNCFCIQTSVPSFSLPWPLLQSLNQQRSEHPKLANESVATMLSCSPNTLCRATWNMLPLMWVCLFHSDHFVIEGFFEKLSLEPCMDVLSQTSIQVIDSTVHYNTENIWKVHLCRTLVNVFFSIYSQVTFTKTVWFFRSPKPLFALQVNMPVSVLLMFGIFSSFPSGSTPVFPWFPGFSLVHVMFGFILLDTSQINCKFSPSRTVGSPLISVIFNGTKSNKTITSKL